MATRLHAHHAAFRRQPPRLRLLEVLQGVSGLWRQRRTLAQLDAHLLEDLGLTRAEAEREARRAMWDVPRNWRS